MIYPTLDDIFLQFAFDTEKTPQIKELHDVMNDNLDRLINEGKLSNSEAARLNDQKTELEVEARSIGFRQGFRLAVRLFLDF